MIENGMWSVFQYIDPISNKKINLFDSLGEIKFYELKKYIQEFKGRFRLRPRDAVHVRGYS